MVMSSMVVVMNMVCRELLSEGTKAVIMLNMVMLTVLLIRWNAPNIVSVTFVRSRLMSISISLDSVGAISVLLRLMMSRVMVTIYVGTGVDISIVVRKLMVTVTSLTDMANWAFTEPTIRLSNMPAIITIIVEGTNIRLVVNGSTFRLSRRNRAETKITLN